MSHIIFDIMAIHRCGAQHRSEKMAAFGLKGCHTSYLLMICSHPGISQDRLAQKIFINKSNVARQAAYLEEEGYIIRRSRESDKRVLELYPTEKAMALLPQIREILTQWDEMLTGELTPEELEITTRVLEKMKHRAGEWMEEN